MTQNDLASDSFLSAAQVRRFCGDITRVTLYRWTRDPTLEFPAPATVNGHNYWRKSAILAWWENRLALKARPKTVKNPNHRQRQTTLGAVNQPDTVK